MEKLLGFKKLDFLDDKGNPVRGVQLFTSYLDDGVTGEACGKLFIRDGIELPSLSPGMVLEIGYNRKGRPISVKAASVSKV